jgi:hypothetical protein
MFLKNFNKAKFLAKLGCYNNPCVSKPNHLDQTHEHTKVYLLAVSNPDTHVGRRESILASATATPSRTRAAPTLSRPTGVELRWLGPRVGGLACAEEGEERRMRGASSSGGRSPGGRQEDREKVWRPRFLIIVINANDRISRVKPVKHRSNLGQPGSSPRKPRQ